MKFFLSSLLILSCSIESQIFNSQAIVHPNVGKDGMVVTQHYLATDVGHSILQKGGNAYDASIAVAFALAVVLPRAGNIGGGGFMLMHDGDTNKNYSIDYREIAPAGATKDMYLNKDGSVDKNDPLKALWRLECREQFMVCGRSTKNLEACHGKS